MGGGAMQMSSSQMQHQQLLRTQGGGVMNAPNMSNNVLQHQMAANQQHQQQQMQHQGANQMMQMQMSQSVTGVTNVTGNGAGNYSDFPVDAQCHINNLSNFSQTFFYVAGSPLLPHQQFLMKQVTNQQPQQQQHNQQSDPSVGDLTFDQLLDNLQPDFNNIDPSNIAESANDFNLDNLL